MDSRKAEGWSSPSTWQRRTTARKFVIELSNATLTNIEGFQADDPDLTLTIDRADLEATMMGKKTLMAQIEDGTAKIRGDKGVLEQLASTLTVFEMGFEIMPGTKSPAPEEDFKSVRGWSRRSAWRVAARHRSQRRVR